jgi:hypothetical protein
VCTFEKSNFENGYVKFTANIKPVSIQNNGGGKRAAFKNELQQITRASDYIITGTCWIAIDYYCQHVKRVKNPSVYDIDNIIKPIIDGLVGKDGIIIDDVIVNRVTVNWVDTPHDDSFEVEIEYPDLLFSKKDDLIFIKSESGWCFPSSIELIKNNGYMEMMHNYYRRWDSISTEDDYYNNIGNLPFQNFIYHVKIRDKGFEFVELKSLQVIS